MEKKFNVKKIPLDNLINLLIELYEGGVDFVDLSADNSDPIQDKLIITSKESYINPEWKDGNRPPPLDGPDDDDEDDDDDLAPKKSTIETKRLTDEDLEKLL